MSEEQNDKILEFVNITRCSPDDAREMLEISNWDIQDALALYYRERESSTDGASPSSLGNQPAASRAQGTSSRRLFQTFSDLRGGADDGQHSDDEDRKDNNLFTGGEKSGLAVQNPDDNNSRPSQNSARLLDEIFRRAAARGMNPELDEQTSRSPEPEFRGRGQTLGSDTVESREVVSDVPPPAEKVVRTLTFWRNGFSVEDGPLYRYDDPANAGYLEAINAGQAPLSLLNVTVGTEVDVHLNRRLDEDFVAPKRPVAGFQGSGNRLGTPTPSSPPIYAAPPPSTKPAATSNKPVPDDLGDGDVTIMLRFADGSANKRKFQSTDTIQTVYDYVDTAQRLKPPAGYVLQTTFPPKDFYDKTQLLSDARVNNSVLVQRLK